MKIFEFCITSIENPEKGSSIFLTLILSNGLFYRYEVHENDTWGD